MDENNVENDIKIEDELEVRAEEQNKVIEDIEVDKDNENIQVASDSNNDDESVENEESEKEEDHFNQANIVAKIQEIIIPEHIHSTEIHIDNDEVIVNPLDGQEIHVQQHINIADIETEDKHIHIESVKVQAHSEDKIDSSYPENEVSEVFSEILSDRVELEQKSNPFEEIKEEEIPRLDPEEERKAQFLAKVILVNKRLEECKKLGNALNTKEPVNPTAEQQASYEKQLNEAISHYQNGIQAGAMMMEEVRYHNIDAVVIKEFVNTFKLLYSNTALALQKLKKYEDSIMIDNNVLSVLYRLSYI